MKFKSLTIENFMTFRKKQVLPLEDLGLVLVRGENKLSGATDSNGVGKTAIFDALSWVLFGQTLRGIKADDVACRFTKEMCRVELFIESEAHGGANFKIVRTRRPAKLLVTHNEMVFTNVDDSIAEVQAKIDQFLGFGFRTFRNAVVFGQGAFERFALAGQADQMRMLDEIQGLDFGAARERAKDWLGKAERRRIDIDNWIFHHNGKKQDAEGELNHLKKMRDTFEREKTELVHAAQEALKKAEANYKREETNYTKVLNGNEKLGGLRLEVQILKQHQNHYDVNVFEHESGLRGNLEFYRRQKDEVIKRMKDLLVLDKCPTCRQVVKSNAKEIAKAWDEEIKVHEDNHKEGKKSYTEAAKESVKAVKHLAKLTEQILKKYELENLDKVKDIEIAYGEMAVKRQNDMYRLTMDRVREAKVNLSREKVREWSGDGPLRSLESTIKDAKSEIATLQKEREKVQDAEFMAAYWVEAFGDRGLRSLMFDSLAPFLNQRLSEHLETLTAGEVLVNISALSALKKGGVKEKLSVAAEWAWGAGSYSGGSAGQDRRIDLALFGALQDLAETRSARPFPLRIWDEAGDSLDSRGKEVFAEWIRKEARRRGSGFVITHDREFGEIVEADNVWTVILDENGARVEI